MKTRYSIALATLCALSMPWSCPDTDCAAQSQATDKIVADASDMINDGDYDGARRLLENHLTTIPKNKRTPRACLMLGICDYEVGNYEHAFPWFREARDKGALEADLYLGRLAFLNYDFPTATTLYGQYAAKFKNDNPELESFRRELDMAENALNAVDRITIIDSIAVSAPEFFRQYRISPSSGRILPPEDIPFERGRQFATTAFANERGDFMMWSQPDSLGYSRIVESIRLTDGSWHEPVYTPESLNMNGDADFPFMMPDGLTLYYASDGEESMGGLDIFVAGRDAGTGEYLEPRNVGMPYNSPYDDFLLAIDEYNGIGWWATDRNLLGDKVTIYVYKLNDMRRNYKPDTPDLISLARLDNWRATAKANEEDDPEALEEKREAVESIPDAWDPSADDVDFTFRLPGGRAYHFLSDFKVDGARRLMQKYLDTEKRMATDQAKLADLRQKYMEAKTREAKQAIGEAILPYEASVEAHRNTLLHLRSDIIRTETAK